jgi:hypothetical protein
MINELKIIVQNYLNNINFCSLIVGTVENDGIRISDKLIIPNELIIGNLKSTVVLGQKIWLIRNHGGQQFYILEVIN